jgi:uncharacterized protein
VTLAWAAAAGVIFLASLVMGLAGFGIALVALAFLPFVMTPATAVVLITLYASVFGVAIVFPLRRDVVPGGVALLIVGTILGAPLGVFILASVAPDVLRRLIGIVLIGVAVLDWCRVYPARLQGRGWALSAGVLAGVLGGAVGTPGPPVILYAMTQGWSQRTIKANLQAFFVVNQAVTLIGFWVAGLLTTDIARLAGIHAVPAALGVAAGVTLFNRVDAVRFRRIVFAILFVSGVVLLVRG